jgi:hypothetical protein
LDAEYADHADKRAIEIRHFRGEHRLVGAVPTDSRRRGHARAATADSRDELMFVVAGGSDAWIGLFRSAGGWENSFVTKKIDRVRNSLFDILNFKYFYLALTGCFQGCIWIASSFMLFEKTIVLQYRHCHLNSFAGGP